MSEEERDAKIAWYRQMAETYANLPEDEKKTLEEWARENLGREGAVLSDWPGWEKYIGERP